jgi:hypothetical protein
MNSVGSNPTHVFSLPAQLALLAHATTRGRPRTRGAVAASMTGVVARLPTACQWPRSKVARDLRMKGRKGVRRARSCSWGLTVGMGRR